MINFMKEFNQLYKTVERLVKLSTTLKSNPKKERKGGVFRYAPNNTIETGLVNPYTKKIGIVPDEELPLYQAISGEKMHRLFAHWLRSFNQGNPLDVFSSWQTRDFDRGKYGGAILTNTKRTGPANERMCDIFSFSGLYEPLDESVTTIAGLEHALLLSIEGENIIKFSNNPTFRELYLISI